MQPGRNLGENGKPSSSQSSLDCSGPMIPGYVLCFMPTCVSFVPRTKMEVFEALAATVHRQSVGRFGMSGLLCYALDGCTWF